MRMSRTTLLLGATVLALGAGSLGARWLGARRADAQGTTVVTLCDNETKTTVPDTAAKTHEDGQKIADALMSQWRQKNPDRDWLDGELEKHTIAKPADNTALVGRGQGQTYGQITERDVQNWSRESLAMAANGSTVFHNADQLGSTIAVSCDMCHPNAANTHPETYPKFQVQLGRVALLRDMINWCIENPVRGQPLHDDDPRLKALEAYILAQRKGTPLNYGKR